jgi:hypothetical protein
VLYEMIAGRAAFAAQTPADTMSAVFNEEPPDITEPIPARLASVIRRSLEKEPSTRFRSATELFKALRATVAEAEKILQSKSALEGERKQVTVLFADVKGSMELGEKVDPEEWYRIMRSITHFPGPWMSLVVCPQQCTVGLASSFRFVLHRLAASRANFDGLVRDLQVALTFRRRALGLHRRALGLHSVIQHEWLAAADIHPHPVELEACGRITATPTSSRASSEPLTRTAPLSTTSAVVYPSGSVRSVRRSLASRRSHT